MPIRAVVFDIGGVLEITPKTGWTQKWSERLQLNLGEVFERLTKTGRDGELGTCSEAQWLEGLKEITGMTQIEIDEFMQDLWEEYLGELNTELAAYFAGLRSRYQTAILSNSFLGARHKEQERYHFDEMTDLIIYSHEVGIAKPDKRIFELTAERLGLQPAEIVFLDDNETNIAAVRALGIHAILFKDTHQAIADLQSSLQPPTSLNPN